MKRRRILILIMLMIAIGGTAYWLSWQMHPRQTLLVGIDPTFPPFAFRQADGQYAGLEVDLIRYLTVALRSDLQIKEIPFADLLTGLNAGTIQVAVSGIPVRADTILQADFSLPYYDATQVALMKTSEMRHVTKLADLGEWRLAVMAGSLGEFEAVTLKGSEQAGALIRRNSGQEVLQELLAGTVDAAILDRQMAARICAGNDELRMVTLDFRQEQYAVAVDKGQVELLQQVNDALRQWQKSGQCEQAMVRWLDQ